MCLYTMYKVDCTAFMQLLAFGSIPNNVARAVLDLDPRGLVKDNHGLSRARSVGAPLLGAVEIRSKVTVGAKFQLASGRATAVSTVR